MNISIQTFRAFEAAAETGSFTKAARQLYLTQPAFSRLIASLEQELGVTLFVRSTRSVSLSPAGLLFRERAREILRSYDQLLCDMEQARREVTASLTVGFNPVSGSPEILISAIKTLQKEHPGVKATLSRAYSPDLVEGVCSGTLDCALVSDHYFPPVHSLCTLPLQHIVIYALMNDAHPLASLDSVGIRDLSSYPLVFMTNSAPLTRKHALEAFRALGLTAVEDPPAEDLEELIVRTRLGNAIGVTSFGNLDGQYGGVCARPIREMNTNIVRRDRVLAWHKNNQNPALPLLRSILEQSLSEEPSV